MIFLDNDTDYELNFDYESVANQVVNQVLKAENCPWDVEVNILLTNDAVIQEYNREQRNIDSPTDVLSFPNLFFENPSDFIINDEEIADFIDPETDLIILGDIILNLDRVKSQAISYGHSELREYAFLIAHSMCHLCGYDHMTEEESHIMEAKQEAVLKELNITREV